MPAFDPRRYFEDIIGVTLPKDNKIRKVSFKVSVDNAKYLITKPIHASQNIIESTSEFVVFEISVIPNFELESVLLSLGDQLEVIGPEALRQKISERVEQMQKLYE